MNQMDASFTMSGVERVALWLPLLPPRRQRGTSCPHSHRFIHSFIRSKPVLVGPSLPAALNGTHLESGRDGVMRAKVAPVWMSSMRTVVREGFLEERTGEWSLRKDGGSQAVEDGLGDVRADHTDSVRSLWGSLGEAGPGGPGLRLRPEGHAQGCRARAACRAAVKGQSGAGTVARPALRGLEVQTRA